MSGCVIAIGMMYAGCVAVCLFIWRYREKRMSKAYQNLLQRLDQAIGGEIRILHMMNRWTRQLPSV